MKYNYVYFGNNADFMRIPFSDLKKVDWAKYICTRIDSDSKILTKLYQLHTSPKTNRFFKLPGQGVWNRMMFRGTFPEKKPLCFVFYPWSRWLQNGIIPYLRKKYPDCKIAVVFQDLISVLFRDYPQYMYPGGIKALLNDVDIALSFDHAEAKEYGMHYYPLVYSPYDVPEDDSIPESDVYFVGKAKDRLPEILTAFEKFRDAGLKCDFYLTGVKPEDQKYADEITYGTQIPYVENLKHIKKTKCLLEIMQGGGRGYTLRFCEVIMYDKKLITNNPEICDAPFFHPDRISVFEKAEDLDADFVLREPIEADYGWKEKLSPIKMLEYIDERI